MSMATTGVRKVSGQTKEEWMSSAPIVSDNGLYFVSSWVEGHHVQHVVDTGSENITLATEGCSTCKDGGGRGSRKTTTTDAPPTVVVRRQSDKTRDFPTQCTGANTCELRYGSQTDVVTFANDVDAVVGNAKFRGLRVAWTRARRGTSSYNIFGLLRGRARGSFIDASGTTSFTLVLRDGNAHICFRGGGAFRTPGTTATLVDMDLALWSVGAVRAGPLARFATLTPSRMAPLTPSFYASGIVSMYLRRPREPDVVLISKEQTALAIFDTGTNYMGVPSDVLMTAQRIGGGTWPRDASVVLVLQAPPGVKHGQALEFGPDVLHWKNAVLVREHTFGKARRVVVVSSLFLRGFAMHFSGGGVVPGEIIVSRTATRRVVRGGRT
jgi:hypothetical protein